MNAATLLAPAELRAAFRAHKLFLGWAAIGVGLLADFMSVLGPVALYVFLLGFVARGDGRSVEGFLLKLDG
jgi:hypothetical protein